MASSRSFACYGIGRQVAIVEPVVRIQSGSAVIPVTTAVILVGTTLGNELDLKRTFAGTFGAGVGSRNSYFTDSVCAWTDVCEETVVGLEQVVLNVYAVERDVERALRQTVYRRLTRSADCRRAGQCQHQVKCITRGCRDIGDLATGQRGSDGGRLRLQ